MNKNINKTYQDLGWNFGFAVQQIKHEIMIRI